MNWIKVKSPLIGNDDLIQLKVESSNRQKVKSRVLKQYFVLLGLFFFKNFVVKFFFHIHDLHNILEVIYSIFLLIKQMFLYDMN